MQNGLINRKELSRLSETEQPVFNDHERFDGHSEAICLTISYPNYRMFYKLNNNNPAEWALILINASILSELDCAFCYDNAASSIISRIPLANRRKFEALEQMFRDTKAVSRKEIGVPVHFPTNPQAEVLVFNPIPSKYIKCIHFRTLEAMKKMNISELLPEGISLEVNDTYFKPRHDWHAWQTSQVIQDGQQEFQEEEEINS
jgi:hypothetical protein